jgi:hypothetical protein
MTPRDSWEVVALIRANTANLDYFFSNLTDASWLPVLLEEGFFRNPHTARNRHDRRADLVSLPKLAGVSIPCSDCLAGTAVGGRRDEVRRTLSTLIESDDDAARRNATDVLHLLGTRGMTEFRDLLPRGRM